MSYAIASLLTVIAATVSLSCAARDYRYSAGNGGLATRAMIAGPSGLAIIDGVLYIAEMHRSTIRRIDLQTGRISALKTSRRLEGTLDLVADTQGRLLVVEAFRISRIDPRDGVVTTVAGTGSPGDTGDGGLATAAHLSPSSCAVTAEGDVYIADAAAKRIRRVDGRTGLISTFAGTGQNTTSGDGRPAIEASFEFPDSVAIDNAGNVYVAQSNEDPASKRIRRIDAASHLVETVAGPDTAVRADNSQDARKGLLYPGHLLLDGHGGLLFVDAGQACRVDLATREVRVIAGGEATPSDTSDGTRVPFPATSALAIAADDSLLVADFSGNRVWRIDRRSGRLTLVGGNGKPHIDIIWL